jgi:aspartyl-tRNA(Asn)/glutamyl-tRNA(Gln) amidotransferase subunit C
MNRNFRNGLHLNRYFCWMEINDELIDKLALLSRLQFDATEKAAIKNDLQKMLGFIDKLNEIDTTGVTPLVHIGEHANVFRKDDQIKDFPREDALLNSRGGSQEFFTVPKVIVK